MQKKWWVMNRRVLFAGLLVCLIVSVGLLGCTKKSEQKRVYTVTVQESLFFTAETPVVKIEQGGHYTTELRFEDGYVFDACNYDECRVEVTADGVVLSIDNVQQEYRLVISAKSAEKTVSFPESERIVRYYANGGTWLGAGEFVEQTEKLSYHYRINTLLGKELVREGYTLIGWNTKADGTGEHIGLGSRTDSKELYAEWVPWIETECFTFRRVEGGIALTGYRGEGNCNPFVLPARIEGMSVVQIDSSFTTNMPCRTLSGVTIVLPASLERIKSGAFCNAAFSEIYFFDTLIEVEEGAFEKNICTYHINAATAPVFQQENDNARFADKVDYLMLQSGKRFVVFGGCSVSYGIKSEMLEREYPEYSVCNMGVIGGVNAEFQLQILERYLREGDILLHTPEQMSPFQLMKYTSLDYRMFIMTEGNYDLLSLVDFGESVSFWENYNSYQKIKLEQTEGSYSDGKITYNRQGDIIVGRPYEEERAWERDVSLSDYSYRFDLEFLSEEGVDRLCMYYNSFEQKGVDVYVGYAPVNRNGLESLAGAVQYEELFCSLLEQNGYHPIGSLQDHLFLGRFFYDSDYHLNDMGAVLQTRKLIEELEQRMQ